MTWPDEAAAGFPGRHPDEPRRLREDILDEIGDHLDCATARELGRLGNEQAARAAALERFGDPKKIARRLWLDAMKETLMRQRLLLATCIVLAAACIAAVTMSWIALQRSQRSNEALLTAMEKLTERSGEAAEVSSWPSVRFTVVDELGRNLSSRHLQAVVHLRGQPFSKDEFVGFIQETVDAEGIAFFGPIPAGSYSASIYFLIDEEWQYTEGNPYFNASPLNLYEGAQTKEAIYEVVVPKMAPFSISVDLPPDLIDQSLLFYCETLYTPSDLTGTTSMQSGPKISFDAHGGFYRRSGDFFKAAPSADKEKVWPCLVYKPRTIQVYRPSEEPGASSELIYEMSGIDSFEVKPSKDNHWKIELKPGHENKIREALKPGYEYKVRETLDLPFM